MDGDKILMEKLTSRERNILRKEAHTLKPVIMIGKNGYIIDNRNPIDFAVASNPSCSPANQDNKFCI